MTQPDLELSQKMFERAIELDPAYSPAWASLAMVHATLYEWFGARDADLVCGERASQRALELAPDLAEAHVAHGCALALSRRYEEAAAEFEEAITLNPNLFEAHYYFGRMSFARGDIARSAELFGRAADVRQEDFQSPMLQGQSLEILGRLEEFKTANREGIRRAERALLLNPIDGRALSLGSGALLDDGQTARAIEWAHRAIELYPDDVGALMNVACTHAKLDQKDEAMQLLERAFASGRGKRDWIEHDRDYDSLRDDPRFQELLAKLK
jgi:adenylate cyclase